MTNQSYVYGWLFQRLEWEDTLAGLHVRARLAEKPTRHRDDTERGVRRTGVPCRLRMPGAGPPAVPHSGDVPPAVRPQDPCMTVRPLPSSWLDEPVTAGAPPDQPGFSLPVGTVTFLLTDVEGSTRQWEAEPEAMAVAIARHYELLDDAIVGAQRRAPGRAGRRRQRGRRVRPGVRRARRRGRRAARAARRAVARRRATLARADGDPHRRGRAPRRGQLLRADGDPLRTAAGDRRTAARCSCRARPPTSSASGSRRTRRSPTSGCTG